MIAHTFLPAWVCLLGHTWHTLYHKCPRNVNRYSPTGLYIACDQETHQITKAEMAAYLLGGEEAVATIALARNLKPPGPDEGGPFCPDPEPLE